MNNFMNEQNLKTKINAFFIRISKSCNKNFSGYIFRYQSNNFHSLLREQKNSKFVVPGNRK